MRSTRLVEEREVAGATLDAPRSANPAAEGQHLPVVTAVGDEVDRPSPMPRPSPISRARVAMAALPPIVREALFEHARSTEPLTVGKRATPTVLDAERNEEHGYLSWVEDVRQAVTPRDANPRVAAAAEALQRVRAVVFGGASSDSRARAAPWARILLQEQGGIEDPDSSCGPCGTSSASSTTCSGRPQPCRRRGSMGAASARRSCAIA
jgi:hypothetical protein